MVSGPSSSEWVLMYRKGLTAARIADICHVHPQVVTRALGWAKRREHALEEEHLSNAPKSSSVSPRWAKRCQELALFAEQNGRMPFAKGHGASESSLGRWLAKQRTGAARGDLHQEKRRALAAAGAWEATPRSQSDARRWEERLGGLAAFWASEGRLPSYRRPSSETERLLGTWLHSQRQQASNKQLTADKRQSLQDHVPGWNTWRVSR
jgi:hypothetical protein